MTHGAEPQCPCASSTLLTYYEACACGAHYKSAELDSALLTPSVAHILRSRSSCIYVLLLAQGLAATTHLTMHRRRVDSQQLYGTEMQDASQLVLSKPQINGSMLTKT